MKLKALRSVVLMVCLASGAYAGDTAQGKKNTLKYPLQVPFYKRQGPSFFVEENCPPGCPRKVMILSLDGGGVRGVMLARVLAHIEHMTGKRIHELFDYIAGTSTGGIVATGMSIPDPHNPRQSKYRAEEITQLYLDETPTIFTKNTAWSALWGITGAMYDAAPLRGLAQHFCGVNLTLSNLVTPILLTSYRACDRTPFYFSSLDYYEGKKDYFAWQAGRSTAAAPLLFAPEYVDGFALRDGGVYVNNPSFLGYKEAKKLFATHHARDYVIVSIGTGVPLSQDIMSLQGLKDVSGLLVDFLVTQMHFAEDGLKEKFKRNYVRIQPEIENRHMAIDNIDPENMRELIALTDEAIIKEKDKFDYLKAIWDGQGGKHMSSYDKWRELRFRVQEKYNIKPHEFTRTLFFNLCRKLKLSLTYFDPQDFDEFSYDEFFRRLNTVE